MYATDKVDDKQLLAKLPVRILVHGLRYRAKSSGLLTTTP